MNDFPLPKDSYVAFDGFSIKQKIKERLNQTNLFTDQNYEGSNIAGINDAIAMSFSLLLYYLNQSSINGQFSETTVYENINRIVKELNYNPIGHQTSNVSFNLSCTELDAGFYTIPRYSTVSVGGIPYTLNKDLPFTKPNDLSTDAISDIEADAILHQGRFMEFPAFTAAGNANEIVYLSVDDNQIIDNFNIDVYVQTDGVWEKWTKTQSLYLNNYSDKVYELRFNENKRYEIKFGDDINGKKLNSSNRVQIYYLSSNGDRGEIGVGALEGRQMSPSISSNLANILQSENVTYMDSRELSKLIFYNKFPSTYYSEPESIESIKKNAPGVFRSQFNITTKKSYETFVKSNFANIIQDVRVMNNTEYSDSYLQYFYNLGLTKPQYESRALFNQVNYADACNFNNVYIFAVPKTIPNNLSYVTPAQKQLIIDTLKEEQVLTSETIIADPVYITFEVCLPTTNTISQADINNSAIYIQRSANSRRYEASIKFDIETAINDFFDVSTNKLGQTVNLQQLNTNILNIDGVSRVYTLNIATNNYVEGIRFVYWNPVYAENTITQAPALVQLDDFQFPFLNNRSFVDRIIVR